MKILVYGAGVLGCNLARNLLRAGKDVTLLARGNWAAEIKQNGLRIKDKFSLRTSVSRIPVVTELAPDAMYDVIFVVLRYTQLDSVLDTLRANRTKNIVFVGNNVQARALAAALPERKLNLLYRPFAKVGKAALMLYSVPFVLAWILMLFGLTPSLPSHNFPAGMLWSSSSHWLLAG